MIELDFGLGQFILGMKEVWLKM